MAYGEGSVFGIALTVVPLALVSVVARRMGRGWLIVATPWILALLVGAIYSMAAAQYLKANNLVGTLGLIAHLVNVVTPLAVVLSLALLAVLGTKRQSTTSEPA
jgi:hypothetical protein